MKKKILIAIFITTIMLVIPFTAIADDPSCFTDEERKEEPTNDTQLIITDPSTLSAEEINDIIITAIEELSIYYSDDPNFQQIQIMIEDQIMPLNWEQTVFCVIILTLIVIYVARALDKTQDAIRDIIDEEGILAFINGVLAGTYGTIAMILASIFFELCLYAPALPPGSTYIPNNCGCTQSSQAGNLEQQGT